MWCGDSSTSYESIEIAVNQLLTLGVVFGGSDIPAFYGIPTDDLFI
jgi:alpha-glucosidase (family GH31 glycosyl hydrolase)